MSKSTNHPASHWRDLINLGGKASLLSMGSVYIPPGETLGVAEANWRLFFQHLGVSVSESPVNTCELNEVLVDALFFGSDHTQTIKQVSLGTAGHISTLIMASAHDRVTTMEYSFGFSGGVERVTYWLNEQLHNSQGPAQIHHYPDGTIRCEKYWVAGKRHNSGGPADIDYFPNGTVMCETYWLDGDIHNTQGPAISWYNKDGVVECDDYCVGGKRCSAKDFAEAVNAYTLDTFRGSLSAVDYKNMPVMGAVNI